MLRSQPRASVRSLLRNKGYLLLNITGLAIGLAAVLMIGSYVMDDILWDGFHPKGDRVYRINQTDVYPQSGPQTRGVTMPSLGPAAMEELPEVEAASRLLMWGTARFMRENMVVANGTQYIVDPEFLKMFGWHLTLGDSATALDRPDAVILDETLAKDLFGDQSPLGKSIQLMGEEKPVVVTGVFRQEDAGSHIAFDLLRPLSVMESAGLPMEQWQNAFLITYLMTSEGADAADVAAKLNSMAATHTDMSHTEFSPSRWVVCISTVIFRSN